MNDSQKIEELLHHFRMEQKDFAEKCGFEAGIISNIKREKSGISKKVFDKIVNAFPEVNKNWLATGEGNMLNFYTTLHKPNKPIDEIIAEMDPKIIEALTDKKTSSCPLCKEKDERLKEKDERIKDERIEDLKSNIEDLRGVILEQKAIIQEQSEFIDLIKLNRHTEMEKSKNSFVAAAKDVKYANVN